MTFKNWFDSKLTEWRRFGRPYWSFTPDQMGFLISLIPPDDCSGILGPYPEIELRIRLREGLRSFIGVIENDILYLLQDWDHKVFGPQCCELVLSNLRENLCELGTYQGPDWKIFTPRIETSIGAKTYEEQVPLLRDAAVAPTTRWFLNAVMWYSCRPEICVERNRDGRKYLDMNWKPSERKIVGPFDPKRIYEGDSSINSGRKLHTPHWRGQHMMVLRNERFGRNPNGGFRTILRKRCFVGKNLINQVTA